jgi:hypothetical protein
MALSFYQRKKVDEPQTALSQYNPTSSSYWMNSATKPAATPPPTTTPAPDTTQKQTTTDQTASSPFVAYLKRAKTLADTQTANQNTRAAQQAKLIEDNNAEQTKILEARKPRLQANFDQFKADANAQVTDETANSEIAKQQNADNYGKKMRQAAEVNRSTQRNLEDTFAGLNTADSNAFQNRMINGQSRFAGGQQELLGAQANEETTINNELNAFKRQAAADIRTQEQSLYDKLDEIDATMADGSLAKEQAILKAYGDASDNITKIESGLLDLESGFAKSQYESDGKTASGNKLPAAQAIQLGDYDNSITQLTNLQSTIQQFSNVMGPIRGRLGSSNPYDTNAQNFQGLIKGVAQMVGKAMEGGVLRAEDVPKYEAILPNIKDTQEVAQGKINNVIRMLTDQKQSAQQSLASSGYNTPNIQNNPMQSQIITAPDGQQIIIVD